MAKKKNSVNLMRQTKKKLRQNLWNKRDYL